MDKSIINTIKEFFILSVIVSIGIGVFIWQKPTCDLIIHSDNAHYIGPKEPVSIALEGKWFFKFINEGEYFERDILSIEYELQEVPDSWTNYTNKDGEFYPASGHAFYRFDLELPAVNKYNKIGLRLPKIYAAHKVFVNGEVVSRAGEVKPYHYRNNIRQSLMQLPKSRNYNIVIEVANREMPIAGIVEPIMIGEYDQFKREKSINDILFIVIISFLSCTAIISLFTFFYSRQKTSYLTYSILCLFVLVKELVFGNNSVYEFLKEEPEILTFNVQYILYYGTSFSIPILGLLFFQQLFREMYNERLVKIITVFYFILMIPVLVISHLPWLSLVYQVLLLGPILYLLIGIFKVVKRRVVFWEIHFMSVIVLIVGAIHDTLAAYGYLASSSTELVPICFFISLLLQYLYMAKLTGKDARELKKYNFGLETLVNKRTLDLTARKNEIEKKNNQIISSIQYASRIQNAFMKTTEKINNL